MLAASDGPPDDVTREAPNESPLVRTSGEVRSQPGGANIARALDDVLALARDHTGPGANSDVIGGRLRELAGQAHQAGLRPEELLMLLKSSWRRRPHSHRADTLSDDEELNRLVTMCIEAYFSIETPR